MESTEVNIKKICCFYVSDWHLSVMLLPYISNQVNEDVEITTIFKNDVEKNLNTLIGKLNLKNKEKILKLNYAKKSKINYDVIEKTLKEVINKKDITIISNGDETDIKNINSYIEKYVNKNKIINKNIKIINCYEVSDYKNNMEKIISEYENVLNTSGEKKISEIYA